MPLKVSDGIAAWIKDFQKSDAPQFKGKSKEKRRKMSIESQKRQRAHFSINTMINNYKILYRDVQKKTS